MFIYSNIAIFIYYYLHYNYVTKRKKKKIKQIYNKVHYSKPTSMLIHVIGDPSPSKTCYTSNKRVSCYRVVNHEYIRQEVHGY